MQLYIYNGQITTYYITTTGELFNSKTNKWLKGQINKNGYKSFNITIDGEMHRLYAHRMVAETYIPCEDMKNKQVHHIDENKLNNNVENLQWIDTHEHLAMSSEKWNQIQRKKVYCFDEYKHLVAIYPSIAECVRITRYNKTHLLDKLNEEVKVLSHGFYWSFTEDNTFETRAPKAYTIVKPVGQYNADNVLIEKYSSFTDAERKTGYNRKRISDCANGKIKTYKGYIWKFIEEDIV